MTEQAVTLTLPSAVYDQVKRAAERVHRPLDDVLVEAVSALAPVVDTAPAALRASLGQLAYLNDAALWQMARSSMPADQRLRLEALHDRKQQGPLSEPERAEDAALLQLYRETLLVRAQAAVLLGQRGYDVADPEQFAPLE